MGLVRESILEARVVLAVAVSLYTAGLFIAPLEEGARSSGATQPASATSDIGWPRQFATNLVPIVIYQPQLDDLAGPVVAGGARAYYVHLGSFDQVGNRSLIGMSTLPRNALYRHSDGQTT